MKPYLDDLVGPWQFAFIQERHITYYILFMQELVRVYHRGNRSARYEKSSCCHKFPSYYD